MPVLEEVTIKPKLLDKNILIRNHPDKLLNGARGVAMAFDGDELAHDGRMLASSAKYTIKLALQPGLPEGGVERVTEEQVEEEVHENDDMFEVSESELVRK